MTMEYDSKELMEIEIDSEPIANIQEHLDRLEAFPEESDIPTTMEDISEMIKNMKFKHVLMGGVDDADVWKQVEKLDQAYRTLLAFRQEEFKRVCTLLEQKNKELTKQLVQLSYDYSWAYGQLERLKGELENKKGDTL